MSTSILNQTRQELLGFFGLDETITQASGTRLTTASGRQLIDFAAQFGAVPFGYQPASIISAAKQFLDSEQPTFVQPLVNPIAETLAQRLIELAPGDMTRATLTTSGAETVEAAIKLVRAATNRTLILGTDSGFHGKTQGAVGVTGDPQYREPFHVDASDFAHVPYGDLPALAAKLETRQIAAFFVETVQGEAGMRTPPAQYLLKAQELCRQYGTLFVVDEIQTGLGRTGSLFSATAEGLSPDVLLLAKALGGGLVPIGACLYGERAWNRDFDRFHSSTFGINGFSAAIATAVLDQLTADNGRMLTAVADLGAYLRNALERLVERYPNVFRGVDGRGLMQGLSLRNWPGDRLYTFSLASSLGALVPIVCGYLKARHGVHCLPALNAGNVLRIQPSLIVTRAEIDILIEGLTTAAELIDHGRQHRLILEANDFPPQAPGFRPSMPPPAPATSKRRGRCLGRFAFLLHPTSEDGVNGDSILAPLELAEEEKDFMQKWLRRFTEWAKPNLEAGVTYHARKVFNADGDYVEGWLIGSLLQPKDFMRLSLAKRKKLLQNYVNAASELNIDFLGLGAYTSVISNAGVDIVNDAFHTTTGNSLTAMVGVEGLTSACLERGKPLAKRQTGVIGAYGSVGRLASLRLGKLCERLVLLGNAANRNAMQQLSWVAGEIYRNALLSLQAQEPSGIAKPLSALVPNREQIEQLLSLGEDEEGLTKLFQAIEALAAEANRPPPLTIASELESWLPRLEAILSATSNGSAFIDPSSLHPSAVICDCAQPPDIQRHTVTQRPDIRVVEGGLVNLPDSGYRFGHQNLDDMPDGVTYSCLAETIVLTMTGKRRDYSIGKRPPLADAEEVLRHALALGFKPAGAQRIKRAG
ncbi:aspartate aminotransferase family protein [Alkalilimnicola ehrlichii]|uniref:Aspartate aminotransferase family protein n=1 Tax=Alkalilimnicola ehrlichii TaxID=351052 RepID=A0A3E0WT28_9GAMM|nr:aminotransferase class III-fold pyridoxal phosphate-dependent enzyme [Alkalilimnicola ehrlichii]RFA29213.1 aspartate aminotransferase family protein [Alkalilimnicola ehrlichii]RFA36124.1 aspartate aminotransferase family protein [Alkalilimnicola ehrlichii]